MSEDFWIGKKIGGRYAIIELVGQGGMSAVYKANDPNLRRVVAVKLIHSHLSNDPEFVRRFEEEAAAVASLRHPNIIQVFDFNNDGDTYYIVFEFIPGESLQAHLKRNHDAGRILSYEKSVEIVTNVASALDYAHNRGMVHRDIKPANVMLNVQGESILMDFGVVKIVGGDSHTATGAVLGTARYISPEQIQGHSADGRTDIYSLGVMMFEMVSGRPPFDADSALTLLMMHVNDPVPDLQSLRPGIPPDLVRIVNRALEKDRNKRFQNAAEMIAALKSANLEPQAGSVSASKMSKKPGMAAAGLTSSRGSQITGAAQAARPAASQVGRSEPPRQKTPPLAPNERKESSSRRSMALIGGLGAVFLVLLCVAGAAIVFGTGLLAGSDEADQATNTAIAFAAEIVESATPDQVETRDSDATPTGQFAAQTLPSLTLEADSTEASQPTPTIQPSPTSAASPTTAVVPTEAASPTPTATSPPPSPIPTGPQIRIDSITQQAGYYIVSYTPTGYTPALPGTHIHFFWNTVPPENAGVGPTQESWYLYGGPNPFQGYSLGDRPDGATQMCSLVANADHTVQLNTGNCFNLP